MKQELMLVEKLPINEKEIQIPSEELNTIQKSQYLKNLESTRDEIVRKIDACKEYKENEFVKEERKRLIEKLSNNEVNKFVNELNKELGLYNKITEGKLKETVNNINSLINKLEELTSKNENLKVPRIEMPSFNAIELVKEESFISDFNFEQELKQEFEKKHGKLFENKKKILQTHYRLMQDALLYYKVNRFKKLLMGFFKLRDEINKIYIPIIKSQEVVDYG